MKTKLCLIALLLTVSAQARDPFYCYVGRTGSMEPVMHGGDVLYVDTQYDYKDLKVGQIVMFKYKDGLIVPHRLVCKWGPWWVTKGDANKRVDSAYLTKERYIGLVTINPSIISYNEPK